MPKVQRLIHKVWTNYNSCIARSGVNIWQATKYPLMSSIWHYFNVTTPPPNPTFMSSTSKTSPIARPHAFNIHVIRWPHLHLLHVIRMTHQFSSSIHSRKPLLTFISHSLSNLTSLVIINCNTIDDIYSMIYVLQKMALANHVWKFPFLRCRGISCTMHLTSKIWRFRVELQ